MFLKTFKVNDKNSKVTFCRYKAKGWISKRVFQENKARQIFPKTKISYPLISTRTCAYQRVRNVRYSENLACFVFLKHPFWVSPFCLITDDLFKVNAFQANASFPYPLKKFSNTYRGYRKETPNGLKCIMQRCKTQFVMTNSFLTVA